VSAKTQPETRDRILETARGLFASQGCQRTSIREIAEQLGLTKTAVLYHFSTKGEILAELAAPLLDDLDAAVKAASRAPVSQQRWRTIEGVLDVYLAHRQLLSLVIQNMAAFAQEQVFGRYFAIMTRALELVVGPAPEVGERVRGAQVTAMLSDPVILLADLPTEDLRREILIGARRLYGPMVGPSQKSASRPRSKGRPAVMDETMVARAHSLRQNDSLTVEQIAASLGVSRATVYRYLTPDS
jgi:AcrR family transcriptional regulator